MTSGRGEKKKIVANLTAKPQIFVPRNVHTGGQRDKHGG